MKKLILSIIFLCYTFSLMAQKDVKVMTFNIRLDLASDSLNAWQYRKDNVATMLNYYEPDILCMQEVLVNQLRDIEKSLPGYQYIGVGRSDGKDKGEFCPIFLRKDRFELKKGSTFGLSEDPEEIGRKGWDASYERIVTWVILKDKKTSKEFAVFNTHFDHMGQIARRESSYLLMEKISELAAGKPAIITGDFNATVDSEPIELLTKNGFLTDTRFLSPIVYGANKTFHAFGRLSSERQTLIDYVFVRGKINIEKHRIIDDMFNGYLSDHNPIFVNLIIK